ncbi:transcriptional regulator family: Fungal Specific TF [Penicillium robsamsonii]|uniref:transcriptional regulator family: Fungal Specific TF n=1 Tax=Penicillium robsamsonii TaxID=1792511 RepID=UPI0025469718|nr:transcriptional regulator family: Fungal Specific TF [Penicillium robsamsonii]KAJ5827591.1 transcriptional regulator family: Fungal Specific TF [Penicillium robsamsonii]
MDHPPTNDPSLQPASINRRSKPQLSCNLCRRRKLRCDRKEPCATCTARGLALSCAYPSNQTPAPRRRPPGPYETDRSRPRATVHDRLGQLEQIVVSLMQKTTSGGQDRPDQDSVAPIPQDLPEEGSREGATNSEDSPAQSEGGNVWFSSSDAQYVGGTHWAAILDGIADLKEQLEREDHGSMEKPAMLHTFLLYGCKSASKEDILAALPYRPAVDRYISQYFNRLDLASCKPMIYNIRTSANTRHRTLQPVYTAYERFWENPSQTSVMWLGLLFSMICLAVLASSSADSSSSPGFRNPLVDTYREKIVQCLILGEYTKSGRYVFETLYHYLTIEYSIRKDADQDIWILSGISVNIALRMGYHRDPSHLPGISPFAGEMRRRAWATILQGDILISTQMGMPRMIKDWQCDTVEPRNLNDSDFDEDCSELPMSRPETETTTVSHLVARRRIFAALGVIVDFTASVRPVTYDEVMRLDRILNDAETTIPAYLRMKAMTGAVTDPPQVIMHRLFLRLMFHKGQIMLHCKYLSRDPATVSESHTSYSYSRTSCIKAALGILEIQHICDEETGPDGQLYTIRWRASSFMKHEFLTATMLLCFLARQPDALTEGHNLDQIIAALARAHSIWMRSRNASAEAKTAADTLSIVLARQSGDSDMGEDGQGMNNNFALNPGQSAVLLSPRVPAYNFTALPMSFPAEGLNDNGLRENFSYGFPFIGSSQMFIGPAMMMDPNPAWQWQKVCSNSVPLQMYHSPLKPSILKPNYRRIQSRASVQSVEFGMLRLGIFRWNTSLADMAPMNDQELDCRIKRLRERCLVNAGVRSVGKQLGFKGPIRSIALEAKEMMVKLANQVAHPLGMLDKLGAHTRPLSALECDAQRVDYTNLKVTPAGS